MKKKPTEPTMPIMGSRFISMLSSPSRGISGGVSSLTSPSGTAGGTIRGGRLMMTTLTECTHPSRLIVIRPGTDAPVYRDVFSFA